MRLKQGSVLELSEHAVASVARMRDQVGLLSVYVGIPTEGIQRPGGERRIQIKNQLRDLNVRAKTYGNHPYWTTVDRRIEELKPLIESRMAFNESRGSAIFFGIKSGESIEVRSQTRFPDLAILRRRAHLIPLVSALDEVRPFGVVALRHDEARVLHVRGESGQEVNRIGLEPDSADWRELQWPTSSSKSSLPQKSDSLKDNFEDRVLANVLRSVEVLVDTVKWLAAKNRWDLVVLSGDPRLTNEFEKSFSAKSSGQDLIRSKHVWGYQSADEVAQNTIPLAKEARRKGKSDLASRIVSDARAGGPGVVGLRPTLDALRSGRVRTFVFDVDTSGRSERDFDFLEEAVETALESGIEPIPLSGEAAEQLEGAGAQLHW